MASYNVEMQMLNDAGTYDMIYPKTLCTLVDNTDEVKTFKYYTVSYIGNGTVPSNTTVEERYKIPLDLFNSFKYNYFMCLFKVDSGYGILSHQSIMLENQVYNKITDYYYPWAESKETPTTSTKYNFFIGGINNKKSKSFYLYKYIVYKNKLLSFPLVINQDYNGSGPYFGFGASGTEGEEFTINFWNATGIEYKLVVVGY